MQQVDSFSQKLLQDIKVKLEIPFQSKPKVSRCVKDSNLDKTPWKFLIWRASIFSLKYHFKLDLDLDKFAAQTDYIGRDAKHMMTWECPKKSSRNFRMGRFHISQGWGIGRSRLLLQLIISSTIPCRNCGYDNKNNIIIYRTCEWVGAKP